MAATLRLPPALAGQLRAEAQRTGQTQTALVLGAIQRMLAGDAGQGTGPPPLQSPTPFEEFPESLLLTGGPATEQILDWQRAERH